MRRADPTPLRDWGVGQTRSTPVAAPLVVELRENRIRAAGGVSARGVRVQGTGYRVQGSGFRVQGSGFRGQGSGCRVQGSGFRAHLSTRNPDQDPHAYISLLYGSGCGRRLHRGCAGPAPERDFFIDKPLGGPASRHGSLNSLSQVALYLPA